MSLRQSDSEKLKDEATPNFMKSDARQAGDETKGFIDSAASYLPGQQKTRDHFDSDAHNPPLTHDRGRAGGLDSFKPSGEQSIGEQAKTKLDQGASAVQPNESKSTAQEIRDAITPGNHSGTQNEGRGVIGGISDAAVGAKDAVVNAFSGGGNANTHEHR